jgi:acyl-CoA synthetase (AMP-forming)/AMP-acid ligase II
VEIVDPATRNLCPRGRIGEIWISGENVTAGYWKRMDQTEQSFRAWTADTKEGPFLRTGDLGFLRADGELFVVGRLKDLIIIRGRNHAPQDIELTVERCDPAIRPTGVAAFSVERGGEEELVVVAEVKRESVPELDVSRLEQRIRKDISLRHELEVMDIFLVESGAVHKTTSGKLQRAACRKSYLERAVKPLSSGLTCK